MRRRYGVPCRGKVRPRGHSEGVDETRGADVKARSDLERTALHYAAREGKTSVVALLLKAGLDVEAKDLGGQTPRDFAKENKHQGIIRLLDRATSP